MTLIPSNKPIRLTRHAKDYIDRRGFTEREVRETIRGSAWLPAKSDRLEATMSFRYDDEWNGRHYATKQVRAIFVEEAEEIVVVTVYTYYF
jgi:hypothetical protein